jgi:flagellin
MQINHNIAALNTYRQLNAATNAQSKSMEKLSSGLRINSAKDDAAGLSISEKMRSQIRGLDQASRNAQDGMSMIQTAEGALNETHDILQRMRELGVQAGNDTNNDSDREAIKDELTQLKTEIDRIANTTAFNDKKLLNGSLSTAIDTAGDTKIGAAFDNTVVSNIDVSNAQAGKTFTMSYDSTSKKVTLTRSGDSAAQSIDLSSLTPNGDSKTLDFAALGVKVTLTGTATNTDTLGGVLDTKTVKTSSTNSSAEFLIGTRGGADETLAVSFRNMDSSTLGTQNGGATSLATALTTFTGSMTKANAESLVGVVDNAIKDVSKQRSLLGAAQNRLEHTVNNLGTASENLTAAESRIRDVDYALAA